MWTCCVRSRNHHAAFMTGAGRAETPGLEDALDQGYSEFVTYAYSNVWKDGNGVASFMLTVQ